jgi:adenine deaminase
LIDIIAAIAAGAKPVAELGLKIIGLFSKTQQERVRLRLNKLIKQHEESVRKGRPK